MSLSSDAAPEAASAQAREAISEKSEASRLAPARRKSNFDWPSLFAFAGASSLGAASVVNTVHEAYHKKFISIPRSREKTIYTDLYEEYYLDRLKPPSDAQKAAVQAGAHPHEVYEKMGKIQENARKFGAGLIDKKSYMEERKRLTTEFRHKCDLIGKEKLDIPCDGIKRWTEGTFKKMKFLADTGRNHALIGFGTVALVGIGAILVLKHSRGVLNDIQDKLDRLQNNDVGRT